MILPALALTAMLSFPASAQPRPEEPALAPAAPPAAGRAPVAVSFETDPRVELLSVLLMLARPEEFRARAGSLPTAYAERVRRFFAPFAAHPAAARLRAMTPAEGGSELSEVFLSLSRPPELAVPTERAQAERAASRAAFLSEARDFARASRFDRFYAENAAFYARTAAEAEAEAGRGLRPDSVTAYLRRTDAGRHRFVVAPLLPRDMPANLRSGEGPSKLHTWIRAADYRRASPSGFDAFGASPAHDVGHVLLDPLAAPHEGELDAAAALMFDGCAASWRGCALEQVTVAVTVRALAAERGEAAAAGMLRAYAWKYPQLSELCLRLGEWEKLPDGAFAGFYPRLIAVFGEAAARVKAPAPDAAPPRPRRPP